MESVADPVAVVEALISKAPREARLGIRRGGKMVMECPRSIGMEMWLEPIDFIYIYIHLFGWGGVRGVIM